MNSKKFQSALFSLFGNTSLAMLFFVAILPLQVNAQGIFLEHPQERVFLEKGTKGVGIASRFSAHDAFGGGFSVVYSVPLGFLWTRETVFDFGLSAGRFTLDSEGIGPDLNVTALSPFVLVHVFDQTKKIPISFAISGVYEKDFYSGDVFDKNKVDLEVSAFSVGGVVYNSIPISPTLNIVPDMGVIYSFRELQYGRSFGSLSTDDTKVSFAFGLSIGLALSGRVFTTRPGLIVNDDNTIFSVSIGFVFPISARN